MSAAPLVEERFLQIPPDAIAPLWPMLRPRVLSIITRNRDDVIGPDAERGVFEAMVSGRVQCWAFWEGNKCLAVVGTELYIETTGVRVLKAFAATGEDRQRWQSVVVERLTQFARDEGCKFFQMMARPGWERVFPEFKKTHVLLELKL